MVKLSGKVKFPASNVPAEIEDAGWPGSAGAALTVVTREVRHTSERIDRATAKHGRALEVFISPKSANVEPICLEFPTNLYAFASERRATSSMAKITVANQFISLHLPLRNFAA